MHPNIPPPTANTFHVLSRSSTDTDRSSSMEMVFTFGGDADAVKSVAWLHRHETRGVVSHPHPSNACASRRQ